MLDSVLRHKIIFSVYGVNGCRKWQGLQFFAIIQSPVGVLEKRMDELQPHKDKGIIVYCRSGDRAARASATLRKQGFNNIFKLNGGILAWKAANLPVQK